MGVSYSFKISLSTCNKVKLPTKFYHWQWYLLSKHLLVRRPDSSCKQLWKLSEFLTLPFFWTIQLYQWKKRSIQGSHNVFPKQDSVMCIVITNQTEISQLSGWIWDHLRNKLQVFPNGAGDRPLHILTPYICKDGTCLKYYSQFICLISPQNVIIHSYTYVGMLQYINVGWVRGLSKCFLQRAR